MDSNESSSEESGGGDNMDLLYLLLPIIGAFLMLFAVCCCGRKVKEILHMPKEIAIGRPIRDLELQSRVTNDSRSQVGEDSRRRCASGGSQIECVPSDTIDVIVTPDQQSSLLHSLPCQHKRYLGDVTEQELEALLLVNSRLRHDSGIANCSCHRSMMSVEVPAENSRIQEEPVGAHAVSEQFTAEEEDADAITVIPISEDSEEDEDTELEPFTSHHHHHHHEWSHLSAHRDGRTRRKSGNSVQARLHRSLCEDLHATDPGAACLCVSGVHRSPFRYTVSFDCAEDMGAAGGADHHHQPHRMPSENPSRDRGVDSDSRRRHLSVGSCDTAESDIVLHVVDSNHDMNPDNAFS